MGFLTTNGVARRLGVTPATIKRWADSGFVRCERTAGRHRRFSEEEIERLVRARGDTAIDRWLEQLLSDADRALHCALLLERARLGAWWRVADELSPMLDELEPRWDGCATLLDRRARARLSRVLARVSESLPVDRGAPRVILAAAQNDEHTLGLSLAEVCLRERGWRPSWYGARTPADELVAAIRRREAEAVALSASTASAPMSLAQQARCVGEAAHEAGARLLVVGCGAWPEPLPYGERLNGVGELHAWIEARTSGGTSSSAGETCVRAGER